MALVCYVIFAAATVAMVGTLLAIWLPTEGSRR